ncbi:MAG: sigma-54-dependent Fis family transcriptional regulator [Fibrobacteria bacterium]|nr:sigma-54-dependent Fis family transcriptional regulator [Fibrobacteria bacterium]
MRAPHLLIIEDDESAVFGYTQILGDAGYTFKTASSLKEAGGKLKEEQFDAFLVDLNLPDGQSVPLISEIRSSSPSAAIIVISGNSDVAVAVQAMKMGADNYITKPVDMDDLQIQLENFLKLSQLRKKERIQRQIAKKGDLYWGNSPAMQQLLTQAETVADSETPVLIQGETGTGKGILAKWLHSQSDRNKGAFVDLNCSTFKGELLKSELFGHIRGSFTSAIKDRIGLIEAADGGTLFLDEIGDMDMEVQTQLLKVIEEKTFRRVGENKPRKSDFRLICATHKDIQKVVQDGSFREDLFFRISVFPMQLPPLRERIEDIPGLSEQLLIELGYTHGVPDKEVLECLSNHHWPGNIRELKNSLERALLYSRKEKITCAHFLDLGKAYPLKSGPQIGELTSLDEIEQAYIKKAMEVFKGDKNKVCDTLGISLSSLYRKMPKLQEVE